MREESDSARRSAVAAAIRRPEIGGPAKLERGLAQDFSVSLVQQCGERMLQQECIDLGEEVIRRRRSALNSKNGLTQLLPERDEVLQEGNGFGGMTPAAEGGFRAWAEVTMPEAINHRSSARTSGRSSVGPLVRTGFVLRRSRIGLFATNRNPSIHSCDLWKKPRA